MATRKTTAARRTPLATGEVTTPETPQQPKGYLWDRLAAAKTPAQLREIEKHATAHGYHPEGQFMTALAKRLKER